MSFQTDNTKQYILKNVGDQTVLLPIEKKKKKIYIYIYIYTHKAEQNYKRDTFV